ncbi:hypothetical protein [Marinobacter sp.]
MTFFRVEKRFSGKSGVNQTLPRQGHLTYSMGLPEPEKNFGVDLSTFWED